MLNIFFTLRNWILSDHILSFCLSKTRHSFIGSAPRFSRRDTTLISKKNEYGRSRPSCLQLPMQQENPVVSIAFALLKQGSSWIICLYALHFCILHAFPRKRHPIFEDRLSTQKQAPFFFYFDPM